LAACSDSRSGTHRSAIGQRSRYRLMMSACSMVSSFLKAVLPHRRDILLRFERGLLIVFILAAPAWGASTNSDPTHQEVPSVTFGQSISRLNGPWKFQVGDSPLDSTDHTPIWAAPEFDDSQWETVDLTPKASAFDPTLGYSGYVPGWTAKGHPGYWGYAWYRIRVKVIPLPGERLALEGPSDVDDAYQVFVNGTLLGSFGKFRNEGRPPIVYSTQPQLFRLPQSDPGEDRGAEPATQVITFRVWMEQNTLQLGPDVGGLHTAPQLGEGGVVEAHFRLG
jgi:hypothetical protein